MSDGREPTLKADGTAGPTPAPEPPPKKPERDPWLDNAKFLLVALVVVGHFLTGVQGRLPAAQLLYLWIFTFHIPAFAFLAGYFSRSRGLDARQLQNVVTRLIAPYLIFTVLYGLATKAWFGENRVELIDPFWLLWFLPALVAWRLLTPLLLNLRWPLLVAVLLGLGAGHFRQLGADFALNRTFSLLPFYVLGAVVPRDLLLRLKTRAAAIAGACLLLLAVVVVVLVRERYTNPKGLLFWNSTYRGMDVPEYTAAGVRLMLYIGVTVLIFAVLAVTPRVKSFMTGLGAASIYTYLLHGFIVKTLQLNGFNGWVTGVPGIAATVVLGFVLAAALASPPVRLVLQPVVEPRLRWLLRRDERDPATARSDGEQAPRATTPGATERVRGV